MTVAHQTIRCPYCKEPIATGATRCKHCQSDLAGQVAKKKSMFAEMNTFRTGFLSGILFCLILAVLAYFQFWGGD